MNYNHKTNKYLRKNQIGGNFDSSKCMPQIENAFTGTLSDGFEFRFIKENIKHDIKITPDIVNTTLSDDNMQKYYVLGEGTYGLVIKGTMQITNTNTHTNEITNESIPVAIKYLKKVDGTSQKKICNELYLLNKSSNNNYVAKYYGYNYNANKLYIFVEFINGITLLEYIDIYRNNLPVTNQQNQIPSIDIILNIIKQLISGLQSIHALNIAYRDIRPDNIMMLTTNKITLENIATEYPTNIKYFDFGLSCDTNSTCTRDLDGTISYMTYDTYKRFRYDESFNYEEYKQDDIWALGCTIYELLTGKMLFPRPRNMDIHVYFDKKKDISPIEISSEIIGTLRETKIYNSVNYDRQFHIIKILENLLGSRKRKLDIPKFVIRDGTVYDTNNLTDDLKQYHYDTQNGETFSYRGRPIENNNIVTKTISLNKFLYVKNLLSIHQRIKDVPNIQQLLGFSIFKHYIILLYTKICTNTEIGRCVTLNAYINFRSKKFTLNGETRYDYTYVENFITIANKIITLILSIHALNVNFLILNTDNILINTQGHIIFNDNVFHSSKFYSNVNNISNEIKLEMIKDDISDLERLKKILLIIFTNNNDNILSIEQIFDTREYSHVDSLTKSKAIQLLYDIDEKYVAT
jgi:serine/threonine protein kinase